MAEFKRKVLQLSSGRSIKFFGNSIAINRNLELGEGYAPNILSLMEEHPEERTLPELTKHQQEAKATPENGSKDTQQNTEVRKRISKKITRNVANPHKLTGDDIQEIADYNIRLWMDLKDSVRKYGVNNADLFKRDI